VGSPFDKLGVSGFNPFVLSLSNHEPLVFHPPRGWVTSMTNWYENVSMGSPFDKLRVSGFNPFVVSLSNHEPLVFHPPGGWRPA